MFEDFIFNILVTDFDLFGRFLKKNFLDFCQD